MQNKKVNPLFKEMEELVNKQNEEEFLFFLEKNRDELIKDDPIAFISFHVDFYALKDDFTKTLEVVNFYKNAPYISMEVEDMLNELKAKLEKYSKNASSSKTFSEEELRRELFSGNENSIAGALTYLSKQNIRMYLPLVKDFLSNNKILYKYKTLVLFILIEQKIDEEVDVYKDGLVYTISPSLIDLPFDTYEYELCKKHIEDSKEDSAIINIAIELMNTVQIKNFPDSFIDMDNYEMMGDIYLKMASDYSNPTPNEKFNDLSLKVISNCYKMPIEEIRELISELNEIIVK